MEWGLPSPPVHHNFDVVPTILRGPHELGNPELEAKLGRDWVSQDEEIPGEAKAGDEEPAAKSDPGAGAEPEPGAA